MKILDKILAAARNGVNRAMQNTEMFKRDVFELDGVPAFRQYYTLYIFVWQAIYKGFYRAWHEVDVHTLNNPKGKKRTLATLNAGKMAAAQMARYAWGEKCEICATIDGWDQDKNGPDPLSDYVNYVLQDNGFFRAFGDAVEKAMAMGGAALRQWVEVPKNEAGEDIGEGRVRIGYSQAGQFVPTAWDNTKITSGIFINREAKDGYYYSTVEWHKLEGDTYRITNDVYRSAIKDTAEPQTILGWWYPLNMVYPLLSPDTTIYNVGRTYFQYVRPFGANFADDNSPLGMSIYATALDTLRSLDIIFDSLRREYVLGRKRIIVPARLMRAAPNPAGGPPQKYFDADDEVWEALATDSPDDLKIHDNTAEIRIADHIAGINSGLSMLCAQVGFDPGTLAFDKERGMKTATEVISEHSKTFGTVKAHELNLRVALEEMVHAIIDLASRYGITWRGVPVQKLAAGGYNVSVTFDDSIIQDADSEVNRGIALVGAGLLSKRKFMIDTLGYTPEQADTEIERIKAEGAAGAVDISQIFGGAV